MNFKLQNTNHVMKKLNAVRFLMTVAAYLELPCYHMPANTEENYQNLQTGLVVIQLRKYSMD
jgi:hypothetical protein